MRKLKRYKTVFVQHIPKPLKKGILYVCIPHNISAHLCACGCQSEIFTPISRESGWVLTYDGENASLSPSVGNGAYQCHSHYYLKNGNVQWLLPIIQSSQFQECAKIRKKKWWKFWQRDN